MLQMSFIEPAQSEWVSPIVFAPKMDCSLSLGTDYKNLNAMTVNYLYLTPQMDEFLGVLGERQIFSTLNPSSEYLQIKMNKCEKSSTTFTSDHGPTDLWK